MKPVIPCIIGPTGSGKGKISFELARKTGYSIILCDSKKVYRFMNIGTNKPDPEWLKEVKYYMMDIKNPDEYYSAGDYARDAEKLILELLKKGENFFVSGGGTLYLKFLFEPFVELPAPSLKIKTELEERARKEGLASLYEELKKVDRALYSKISKKDSVRIIRALEVYYQTGKPLSELWKRNSREKPYIPMYIGIKRKREEIKKRIEKRVDKMMEKGFLNEVESLIKMGYSFRKHKSMDSHGYKDLSLYIEGNISFEKAVFLTKKRTKEYSKRQMTFFKNYLTFPVEWIQAENPIEIENILIKKLNERIRI